MATVYLAEQLSLGRRVALKVLSPQLASDPSFLERFLREGRIAAQLRHRHIVAIHDVGVHQGQAYMALDFLSGGSLGEAGPMAPREALRVLAEIASALDLAHRAGVVHRDIKPENILIDEDGRHVLSDFGIARIADAGQPMTREGTAVGTPAYMAPEQWRGETVDGRADLYSLGVVLYRLLTGRTPYTGSDGWAIGMQHMQAPLPRLPDGLGPLQPLLDRLLCKLPGGRFASGAALVQAIDALRQSPALAAIDDPAAATPRLADTTPPWRVQPEQAAALFATPVEAAAAQPRRRILMPAVALTLVALLALAAGLGWRGRAGGERWLAGGDQLATLAVLPCESFANLAAHRELGDTLASELIQRMGRLRALTVIARSSSFPLRDAALTAREIGERLGASHLVSCSIRRAPDGVRIAAELVDTASGAQRWSAEYDRGGDDLLAVVDELALGISERLLEQLAGPERARLIRHGSSSPDAVRRVAQARELAAQAMPAALDSGREALADALRLDPAYADAHVALAELDRRAAELDPHQRESLHAQAREHLQQALAIDPDFAPALALRGHFACADWDWQACHRDTTRALELEPGLAQVQAEAAGYHLAAGSIERALDDAGRALRIDPESAQGWILLTRALLRAGRGDEARTLAAQAVERFPAQADVHQVQALVLQQQGRCGDAQAAWERVQALSGRADGRDAALAAGFACSAQRERAAALLRDLTLRRAGGEPVGDDVLALCHLALGQPAQLFDALDAMRAARDPQLLDWITLPLPGLEPLANDPRLAQLIGKMRLPVDVTRWSLR